MSLPMRSLDSSERANILTDMFCFRVRCRSLVERVVFCFRTYLEGWVLRRVIVLTKRWNAASTLMDIQILDLFAGTAWTVPSATLGLPRASCYTNTAQVHLLPEGIGQ